MSRTPGVQPFVRTKSALAVVLAFALAACAGWEKPAIPFELTDGVETVVTDWRTAGLSCGEPMVGMPGPAVDWWCRGQVGGVEVNARLIADRFGVQSIHVGVPPGTPGADAAAALVAIVEVTSLIDLASPEITAWLLENDAADGTMPRTGATPLGRASIASDDDGHPVLYIVPLGSSMLMEQ
jgi:hypothetical protein